MSVPALVDDLNPEAIEGPFQLSLVGDDFEIVRSLADAGAITSTHLKLEDPEMSYEHYESLGRWIGLFNRACSWWIGDWLVFGEGVYSERVAQAASETGLAEQTLLNRVYVAKHVPPARRRATLAFSTHAEVAALPAKEQERWLAKAEKQGWTRADLRAAMKAKRKDEKPQEFGDPEEIEPGMVIEAARRLLSHAEEAGENVIVRREDVAQLRAALGDSE